MKVSVSKKTLKIVGIVVLVVIALVVVQALGTSSGTKADINVAGVEQEVVTADRIQVVHFHATAQCYSCVVLGEYALKTLEVRFPQELESGRIEFLQVNVDLPQNKDIVSKFGASGSSLFVNLIYDEQDHISEDVSVWRLLNSEIQFRKYLGDKLEQYL